MFNRSLSLIFSTMVLLCLAIPLQAQNTLQLDDRFTVDVSYQDPFGLTPISAEGGVLSDGLGYFHFFDNSNIDVIIQVLSACDINDHYWVFAAGLTDVEVTIEVTDTDSGAVRTYSNPLGGAFTPITDTNAFATCPSPGEASSNDETAQVGQKMLGLNNNRFQVSLDWEDFDGGTGQGNGQFLTNSSGAFTLASDSDMETFVKVLDGREKNGFFWVYISSWSGFAQTITVTDTETNTTRIYRKGLGEIRSFVDKYFAQEEAHRWMFPWVSNNASFRSRLIVNNYGASPVRVTLSAMRADGSNQATQRTIAPSGFLNERADSLFPGLGEGSGYTVTMTASEPSLAGRWVTDNLGTASSGSPSQGVAVKFEGGDDPESTRNGRIGEALMFGYLPGDAETLAAPVIVNVGSSPTNVQLIFLNSQGNLLGTNQLGSLEPLRPFAAVSSDLLQGQDGDVQMIALSDGQPLTGVVFTFNQLLEPSIGNAESIAYVPPGDEP